MNLITISRCHTNCPPTSKTCLTFSRNHIYTYAEELVVLMRISREALRLWDCVPTEHPSRNFDIFGRHVFQFVLFLWDVYLFFSKSLLWSTASCAPPSPPQLLRAHGRFPRCSSVNGCMLFLSGHCCPVCCWPKIAPIRWCISPASHICRRRFSSAFLSQPL